MDVSGNRGFTDGNPKNLNEENTGGTFSAGQTAKSLTGKEKDDLQTKTGPVFDQQASKKIEAGKEAIDQYKLFKAKAGSAKATKQDLHYYTSQAILRDVIARAKLGLPLSDEDHLLLETMMLSQYSKAAPNRSAPASPFATHADSMYHRSDKNAILTSIEDKIIVELNAKSGPFSSDKIILLEDNEELNFTSVLTRKYGEELQIVTTKEELEAMVTRNPQPKVIDVTKLGLTGPQLSDLRKKLPQNINFISYMSYKEETVLYVSAPNSYSQSNSFASEILSLRSHNGFVPTTEHINKSWLKFVTPEEIFTQANVAQAEFVDTSSNVPEIYQDYKSFIAEETALFEQLTGPDPVKAKLNANPVKAKLSGDQKIIADGVVAMLKGLEKCNIDVQFNERGLGDLLQYSYFRINNALREAILRREDMLAYQQALDVVSQEIQMILAISTPYGNDDLEKTIVARLKGPEGIITDQTMDVKVHAQPSAMRCLSTVVSSVQAQKKDQPLNALVLSDSYYETSETFTEAKEIKSSILKGDDFNRDPKNTIAQLDGNIDLFLCEFHHNVSLERTNYTPEKITEQIKALFAADKVAKPLTVMIDSTINLELSDDFKKLFSDPEIKQYITDGKLNIVLARSAQKFDMLGFDNYYGGIVTIVNNGKEFDLFNDRMNKKGDQLQGVNYQGLCHLNSCAAKEIEAYRQAIMDNANDLYKLMPEKCKDQSGIIQIAQVNDDKLGFLDFKFHQDFPEMASCMVSSFRKYCHVNHLPLTTRASFGFPNSNIVLIDRQIGKLCRLSVGLENRETLRMYSDYFNEVQKVIDKAATESDVGVQKNALQQEFAENIPLIKQKMLELLSNEGVKKNYSGYSDFEKLVEKLDDDPVSPAVIVGLESRLKSNNSPVYSVAPRSPSLDYLEISAITQILTRCKEIQTEQAKLKTDFEKAINQAISSHTFTIYNQSPEQNEAMQRNKAINAALFTQLQSHTVNTKIKFPFQFNLGTDNEMNSLLTIKCDDKYYSLKNTMNKILKELESSDSDVLIPENQLAKHKQYCALQIQDQKFYLDMDSPLGKQVLDVLVGSMDDLQTMLSTDFDQIMNDGLKSAQEREAILEAENGAKTIGLDDYYNQKENLDDEKSYYRNNSDSALNTKFFTEVFEQKIMQRLNDL